MDSKERYLKAYFNKGEKLDQHIQDELLRLSKIVNLSAPLSHPWDYNKAIDILKKLKKEGCNLDRDLIKIFVMNDRWLDGSAERLAKMAEKINNGKIVRKK